VRRLFPPVVGASVIICMILLCLSLVRWLLNKKAARRGVNISLANGHHSLGRDSSPVVPDMVISVLKGDVKLNQPTILRRPRPIHRDLNK